MNPKVHENDYSKAKYGDKEDGLAVCDYCGSMTPQDAIRILKEEHSNGSGADWKYGWPHKFYLTGANDKGIKFYSNHLYDTTPEEFKELSDLIAKRLGIRFGMDERGLKYRAPYSDYQTWFGTGYDDMAPKVPEDM